MATGLKKKILGGCGFVALTVIAAIGAAGYFLTRPLPVEFARSPNVVEAHEADRKLKLLNQAQSAQKQGFVRFSEVEINSFLDAKYNNGDATNGPIRLVKAAVLLGEQNFTFITWYQAPIFGLKLPFVWQRVITPVKDTNGWNYVLESMRVGEVNIPQPQWARVEKLLGVTDSLFEERKTWLRSLPMIQLANNEQSKSPEVRLYTYLPEENSKANETASEE